MNHYFGCSEFEIQDSPWSLGIFLYNTLDTVQQNTPPHIWQEGVPPLAVMNHHLFTSLRGIFLGQPGDVLHMKNGGTVKLFHHVVLVDLHFFLGLDQYEFDALMVREEVLYRHLTKTGSNDPIKNPADYYITHDTLACHHGVKARDLQRALRKSKRFEQKITGRIFRMDTFDKFILRVMYKVQGLNRQSRLRAKNLRMLHRKPPLSIVSARVSDKTERKAS